MATYTVPISWSAQGDRVVRVLRAFIEHRQIWGLTISQLSITADQLVVTVNPAMTAAQRDHLLSTE